MRPSQPRGVFWPSNLKEMDKIGLNNVKSETAVPTGNCLQHNVSDQAADVLTVTVLWADRVPDFSGTRRGGGQSWWTVFPRCGTFEIKMPTTSSSPSCCYCLHTPWRRSKRRVSLEEVGVQEADDILLHDGNLSIFATFLELHPWLGIKSQAVSASAVSVPLLTGNDLHYWLIR